MLRKLLLSLALLQSAAAFAQTTIDITVPGSNTVCSYATGPVTSGTTPGHLQATATGNGTGCPSTVTSTPSAPSFGPTQALAPATTTLPKTGGTVTFSFRAVYADTKCTGAITGATGGAFTAGTTLCTASGCNALISAPATFPANNSTTTDNTYNVKVACTGSGGTTDSNTATVIVPHDLVVVSTCPTITSTTAGITNFTRWTGTPKVYLDSGLGSSKNADITSFDALYGTWPGQYGNILYFMLPNVSYLSMAFTIPNNYMTAANKPNPLNGAYKTGETGDKTLASFTISTTCGDFSNPATYPTTSTVLPGCWKNKQSSSTTLFQWNSSGTTCVLQNNKTYYLNAISADISQVQPNGAGTAASTKNTYCSGGTCELPIYNGPGTWSGYTPQ